MIKSLKYNIF